MEIIIRPTKVSAADLTAELILRAVKAKPNLVLGLATGRTMEAVYAALVEKYRRDGVSFSEVRTFNLDEYIGLMPDDPHSYRTYMHERLFAHVDIPKENTHLPNGAAADLDLECMEYEAAVAACGGIDLQLLGIGVVGHIGFNEPLSALRSRTRAKALTPQTLEQNAPMFGGDQSLVPRRAITMGVGTILDSRRCILVATGEEKADIIAKAMEGPVSSMITASALQLHPRCTVIVDEDAASSLEHKEYYRWLFENEPEWADFR